MNEDFTKELLVIAPNLDIVSIKEQNKAKSWKDRLLTLVANDDGTFTHNADDIKLAVEKGINVLKANLKNTDSLDDVAMWSDTLNILHTWLEGTRKESTSVFDEVKTSLMVPEKLLSDMKPLLKQKQNELNESIYKVRRINIFNEFQSLEDNLEFEIEIDFKIFESFADVKKKNKSFDANTKGNLNAAAKKEILEQFHLVVDPIIKEKMLQEEKQKEQQLLTMQLSKLATSGTNEELQLSINELNSTEDTLDIYFPNIKDNAKSQILSLNKVIHNAIDQNDRISKENAQNEKDLIILNQIKSIDINSNDIAYLQVGYHDMYKKVFNNSNMLNKNHTEGRYFLDILDTRIKTLKQNELKNIHVPISKVDPIKEDTHNDYFNGVGKETIEVKTQLKQFKLSDKDIKFISDIKISAVDNNSAVAMMVDYISNHLDFCGLEEIK